MTVKDAVSAAIEIIGDQTSIKTLLKEALRFYYWPSFTESACCRARQQWRKENGMKTDCRTYKGQPRRDMLNDGRIDLDDVRRLQIFFKKRSSPGLIDDLLSLFGQGKGKGAFHSIPQFCNAVKELSELQFIPTEPLRAA